MVGGRSKAKPDGTREDFILRERREIMSKLETIMTHLRTAGGLKEQARLSGKSLSATDRTYINAARVLAEGNLSPQMINKVEEEGAELVRGSAVL